MSQIINITSEALQATIRRLLPSQQGFGEDLQASNVITPVIDLTPTAEGSLLPSELQNAINFGGNSEFVSTVNTTDALTSTAGFYRLTSFINIAGGTGARIISISITDGTTTRSPISFNSQNAVTDTIQQRLDLYFFVAAGETLQQFSNNLGASIRSTVRQVADVNGNLVNPVGFTSE